MSRKRGQASPYALFTIVVLGAGLGSLSQTAVSAMLGDIMPEFGMEVDLGQWLTTSYMLVLGITVPVVTFLTKRLSVRRHILLALAVFFAGALVDLAAPNFALMLLGRVAQAASAGMLLPLMQTIAMTRFPKGRQATAMGVGGIALGFAPNIGPTVGGAMSYTWGWRSFFVLLLVAGAALMVATLAAVRPSDANDATARLDVFSFVLSTLGFGGVLLGFSNASSYAASSPFIWAPLAAGALFLVWFVVRQRRLSAPLIDMRIFSSRRYVHGFIVQNLLYASFMGVTLVIPLYVEGLCGGTSMQAGMVLLPGTVTALIFNPLAGVLTDRIGIRPVAVGGGAFLAAGAVLMSFIDAETPLYLVMVCQGVRAVGTSSLIGPLTSWSLAELPGRIVADGSSFSTAARQACASFGTSVMVLIITAVGATALGAADPALAYQLSFGFSALCAVALFALSVAWVR